MEPTIADLQALAKLFGFELEYDNDGQVVLYTGVFKEQEQGVFPSRGRLD